MALLDTIPDQKIAAEGLILTESQVQALERKKVDDEVCGELESAFKWLDRAIEDREIGILAALRCSPILDPIRNHPRFVSAMARLAEIEAQVPPIKTVAYP